VVSTMSCNSRRTRVVSGAAGGSVAGRRPTKNDIEVVRNNVGENMAVITVTCAENPHVSPRARCSESRSLRRSRMAIRLARPTLMPRNSAMHSVMRRFSKVTSQSPPDRSSRRRNRRRRFPTNTRRPPPKDQPSE